MVRTLELRRRPRPHANGEAESGESGLGQGPTNVVTGVVRAVRPRQWTKNALVLAAPVLSGSVLDPGVLAAAVVAFVAFCLAASGIYLVNDVTDAEADRAHPKKRDRPIAAGMVPPSLAVVVAAALLLAATAVSLLVSVELLIVVLVYEISSLAYSLVLKDEPVIDIAIVASGFLLRAIAGGAAADIALSQWFLLSAGFGSLLMASGKRYAESRLDGDPELVRKSLRKYTQTYLRFVWTLSASSLVMTYGLWASQVYDDSGSRLATISMAPFVLAVLRYVISVDAGAAGEPDEIALSDRVLQSLAGIWLVLLLLAIYA